MTPNDKLPKEITDQIKQAAQNMLAFVPDNKYSYIAGATAWAHWKVKFDELQATIDDKIDKALHAERNKMQAMVTASEVAWAKECQALKDQAQRMADALEEIRTWHFDEDDTSSWVVSKIKNFALKTLQQFKDGKEVGDDA